MASAAEKAKVGNGVAKDDRDWDYGFLLSVMEEKIAAMERYFRSEKAQTMEAPRHAETMGRCGELLRRLIEDDYAKDDDVAELFDTMKDNILSWWD